MRRNRNARIDGTHRAIVLTLRGLGWRVVDTHEVPGFVDAVAHRHGRVRLVEIKTAAGPLTASQAKLIAEGWPIQILRSVDDAIALR